MSEKNSKTKDVDLSFLTTLDKLDLTADTTKKDELAKTTANELENIPPIMLDGVRNQNELIKDFKYASRLSEFEQISVSLKKEKAFFLKMIKATIGRGGKEDINKLIDEHFKQIIGELCIKYNIDVNLIDKLYKETHV